MNIGFYMEGSSDGGPDSVLINIVNAWNNKKDSFTIFCNKSHPGLERIKRELKGKAIFVDLYLTLYIDLYLEIERKFQNRYLKSAFILILHTIRFPLLFYQYLFIKNIFKDYNFKQLFINNGGYPGAESCCAAAAAAHKLNIRSAMIVNGESKRLKLRPYRFIERFFDLMVNRYTDRFIAVSAIVKLKLVNNRFLDKDKVEVIYNGVDLPYEINPVTFNYERYNLGIIGNFRENKGHLILFEAVKDLVDKGIPVNLIVVGRGTKREEKFLGTWVNDKGMVNAIQFSGFKNNIYDIMAGLDVVVMPTLKYEACPVVAIEAMALGKALVASRTGGIPELIHDKENGLLFEPANVNELVVKLELLYLDKRLRSDLGKNGKEAYKKRHTIKKMVYRYTEIGRELMSQK